MSKALDFDDARLADSVAEQLLTRAAFLAQHSPTVASNLAIAQHRDQLRYAKTRSGAYLPNLRKFNKGDYVYLRRPNMNSTLQIPARQTILRVLEVRESGSILLQGRCGCSILNNIINLAPCHLPNIDGTLHPELARPPKDHACERCNMPDDEPVMLLCDICGAAWHTYCCNPPLVNIPKGDWVCNHCEKAGITLAQVTVTRSGRKSATKRNTDILFSKSQSKAAVIRHRAYDGRLVAKKVASRSGNVSPVWGVAAYRGEGASPAFVVQYDDGHEELMSLHTLIGRHPLPAGSKRPQAKLVSCATYHHSSQSRPVFLPNHTIFLDDVPSLSHLRL
jgi:hypothetical protein